MRRAFLATWLAGLALVGSDRAAAAQTCTYFGERGPEFWDTLDPAWAACGTGSEQSPVDLRRHKSSRRLAIDYHETRGAILNNGHTIEVETEGDNVLRLGHEDYELVQFHFHNPSEHRVFGRGHDMELHLVHRSAAGALAVVGVFMRRGPSSGALGPIFDQLPADVDVHHELEEPFNPAALRKGLVDRARRYCEHLGRGHLPLQRHREVQRPSRAAVTARRVRPSSRAAADG